MENVFTIEKVDEITFYGINNVNLQQVRDLFPMLRIVARGNVIKTVGDPEEIARFDELLSKLVKHCEIYNKLTPENILEHNSGNPVASEKKPENTIIFGVNGKPITARTKNQKVLVEKYYKNDLLFAVGPAGSGKTYTAIALAVRALKNKEIRRIILSRPAVEAGESLGFLPGDMKDKIDPYLQPLYDALKDMIPPSRLAEFVENEVIQIAPLAYMRGRTLSDAVVILDEAQNTTKNQLKMFLTRMGKNAKFIITGDVTQIDLPRTSHSGLVQALHILKDIKGLAKIKFDVKDIVRHRLVQDIVKAYDQDQNKQFEKQANTNKEETTV